MTGTTRRDIETRLERALDDVARATIPSDRPRPPYPHPEEQSSETRERTHQPRLHRRWAGPLLIAAVLLVLTLGVSAIPALSSRRHQPATTAPSPSAPTQQPSISTGPAPTKRPSSPAPGRSTAPVPSIDPRTIDLANAVIDIPSTPRTDCSAGRRQFHNGAAPLTGSLWEWVLGPSRLYANLDGQPGDEVLASIRCADAEVNPVFLLVLKAAPDHSLQALGLLNTAGDQLLVYDQDTLQIEGSTVLAEVMGPIHAPGHGPLANKQVRGYGYSGGRFVQVSGPTSFPPLPQAVTGLDLSNTTLSVAVGDCLTSCQTTWIRFVNGTGRAALTPGGPLGTFTQGPASQAKDATGKVIAIMTIRWTTPNGPQHGAAFAISSNDGASPLNAQTIAMTGSDGILTVQSATGTPASDITTVVVGTAQGPQTRTYQAPQYGGQPWKRLS